MIDSYIVRDHALAGFGRPGAEPHVGKYTTATSGHQVGGFMIADCPTPGYNSWATVAMSFFRTSYSTSAGKPLQVELVGCASADWTVFDLGLAFCAFYVADGGPCRPGIVIADAFANKAQQVTTPHAFLVPPFSWDSEFMDYEDADVRVTWLQVVPITEAEAIFTLARGDAALQDVLEDQDVDIYDLSRPSASLPAAITSA